jgi:hypothetical protein
MPALAPPPETAALLGDLRERADGGFDGWCWSPARPDERLIVELLVDDAVAVSMVAAIFRRDLLAKGCGDGRHGFALRLPPNLPHSGAECLITARERRSGRVFARLMRRAGPGALAGGERVAQAADGVDSLWQGIDEVRALTPGPGPGRPPPVAARLRSAFGALAGELGARAIRLGAGRAPPGRAAADPPRGLELVEHARPTVSVLLRAGAATAVLRHVTALAPALSEAGVEVLVADLGEDPACLLLPSRVRNLRYLHAPAARGVAQALALAATEARGQWLVLLDPPPAGASAAALLALGRALATAPPDVLLPAAVAAAAAVLVPPPAARTLTLPASLGLLIGAPSGLWRELGAVDHADAADVWACADLALRARLLGHAWRIVQEPVHIEAPLPAWGVDGAAMAVAPPAAARLLAAWDGAA